MEKVFIENDCLVSVLIPARNEEGNIESCIRAVLSQTHKNIELIVGDDQSSDQTREIVCRLAKEDKRVSLVSIENLPKGWLGKNHVCSVLAEKARGTYLLFLDADVRIYENIIPECLFHMEKYKLKMLSLFPFQEMKTKGELKTIPVVHYILLSLLPLNLVRNTQLASIAAANGQFLLFSSDTYKSMQSHQMVKDKCAEDIAISRLYKSEGHKISCMIADHRVKCRMYNTYNAAVKGFAKNVTAYFGNSIILAVLFWLVTSFGLIPVYFGFGTIGIILYVILFCATRVMVSIICRQSIVSQLKYLIHQQFSLGMFIFYHIKNKLNRDSQWKGRNIIQQK